MANDLDRRDFLAGLGVTLGGAALGELAAVGDAAAQDTPKGRIPETPVKFGHITIQSGPGAILGLPSLKGHTLAAEEINAAGGLLARRKIETITADEAAGPEATVKEVKRMKLSEKIDYFSGVIAAHNQLAVGPVVEELKLLTIMTEGCIDKLFEVEVPNPHYLFGMTNILSADGVTTALAIAKAWPDVKRVAVINPDYAFGRWFQLHFDAAREKLLPGSEIVSEVWAPFPNTADFTSHITKTIAAKPDIVVTSMWGGMYVSFYKQALGQGLFRRARLAGNINFGVVPQAIGKDHPEGALAGVRLRRQQALRRGLPEALERVPVLRRRGRLHGPLSLQDRRREGEQAGRWRLARGRRHHQAARGAQHRGARRPRDDSQGGPPRVQGREGRLQQEPARLSVRRVGSRAHHDHPRRADDRAAELAQARQGPQ